MSEGELTPGSVLRQKAGKRWEDNWLTGQTMEVDGVDMIRIGELCNRFDYCQKYLSILCWYILSRIPRIAKTSREVKLELRPLTVFLTRRSRLMLLSVVVTPFQQGHPLDQSVQFCG